MSKRILIVAATAGELAPITSRFNVTGDPAQIVTNESAGQIVDVLVTGVGMVPTAARCARAFARQSYDLALDVGVCGSFDPELAIGTVVHVVVDRLPEVGAEDGERFITVHDLGLVDENEFPFSGGALINDYRSGNDALRQLPRVRGITVNTVHGRDESIAELKARFEPPAEGMADARFMYKTQFPPQIETMEGAAFMYAALVAGVPFAQVRAVSNAVERRNRAKWNLPLAIENLGRTTLAILDAE
jgi:futalosine hydrolase